MIHGETVQFQNEMGDVVDAEFLCEGSNGISILNILPSEEGHDTEFTFDGEEVVGKQTYCPCLVMAEQGQTGVFYAIHENAWINMTAEVFDAISMGFGQYVE